jgi:hypothetical protein
VGVLINGVVTITFSEPMSPTSIGASSVTVLPTSGGVAVPGSVTYDSPTRTATFSPLKLLDYGTSYTLTVTTAALDLAGNAIAVATSGSQVQMIGTFSGPTHPASRLVLDKTAF